MIIKPPRSAVPALIIGLAMAMPGPAVTEQGSGPAAVPEMPDGSQLSRLSREGVDVEFKVTPLARGGHLREGEFAEMAFRITSSESGEPLRGVYPGVWVDLAQTAEGQRKGTAVDCKTRVGTYLQGLVGMRALIDLNSYYVLVMNRDASISVIDPVIGISNITSLYANIPLKRPAADWVKTRDDQRLFVSIPREDQIAVVDLGTFKVERYLAAGERPMRVALQPDQRYLWVGNDAKAGQGGGVTVIDTRSLEIAATIVTGDGHHEIAFSSDSRWAFVTNRDAATVSVIDIAALKKLRDLPVGASAISVAYTALGKAAYVVDGAGGVVSVIDSEDPTERRQIQAKPGLGPLRFSEDGRWGVMVNPQQDEVYIIDASSGAIAHTLAIAGKPYQVSFSPAFAYVRALDSERVSMINLQALEKGAEVVVNSFAAGSTAPAGAKDLSIADGIVPAAFDAAVLVVSPGDATVYYYMEGMNAPMGAFRNYGHPPRAVSIANRALQEREPGVYSATVKLPAAGRFDVAFLNEMPRFLHCFSMQAQANPLIRPEHAPLAVDYLLESRRVAAGETLELRFRLSDPATGLARDDLGDVRVLYYRAPRYDRTQVQARWVGDGVYEAALPLRNAGAYYVYVGVPSLRLDYNDLNYLTLIATPNHTARSAAPGG